MPTVVQRVIANAHSGCIPGYAGAARAPSRKPTCNCSRSITRTAITTIIRRMAATGNCYAPTAMSMSTRRSRTWRGAAILRKSCRWRPITPSPVSGSSSKRKPGAADRVGQAQACVAKNPPPPRPISIHSWLIARFKGTDSNPTLLQFRDQVGPTKTKKPDLIEVGLFLQRVPDNVLLSHG